MRAQAEIVVCACGTWALMAPERMEMRTKDGALSSVGVRLVPPPAWVADAWKGDSCPACAEVPPASR